MRLRQLFLGFFLLVLIAGCQSGPDPNDSIGGKFVGYTYSEKPVVDSSVQIEFGYTIKFQAYDLGENARFVVYALKEKTSDYYIGPIRLGIHDPKGNAFTHYHNTEGEPIDQPIVWKRRTSGIHKVTVNFPLPMDQTAAVAFDVPLVREPLSTTTVAVIIITALLSVVILVALIRRRSVRFNLSSQ